MRALLYRFIRKRPQVVDAYLALEDGSYCLNENGSNFIVE